MSKRVRITVSQQKKQGLPILQGRAAACAPRGAVEYSNRGTAIDRGFSSVKDVCSEFKRKSS